MTAFYVANEYWFAAAQLSLAMLGMGATLTIGDFRPVFGKPKAFMIGMLLQIVVVPAIAFAFIAALGGPPGLLVAIALIAAIPGGTASNIFTFLARGSASLSIAITSATTLACLVTTPLVLNVLVTDYLPANFVMPTGQIIWEISVFLLAPLAIGMALLKFSDSIASFVSKWGIRGSLLVILMIVVGSVAAGRIDLATFGATAALPVAMFLVVLLAAGTIIPQLAGQERDEMIAIQTEVGIRSTNLALLLNVSLFSANPAIADTVLFAVLLYGGLMLTAAAILVPFHRRRWSQLAIE